MIEFEARVRKMGSSLGVVIPKGVVQKAALRRDSRIRLILPALPPPTDFSELSGKARRLRGSTRELIERARNPED